LPKQQNSLFTRFFVEKNLAARDLMLDEFFVRIEGEFDFDALEAAIATVAHGHFAHEIMACAEIAAEIVEQIDAHRDNLAAAITARAQPIVPLLRRNGRI